MMKKESVLKKNTLSKFEKAVLPKSEGGKIPVIADHLAIPFRSFFNLGQQIVRSTINFQIKFAHCTEKMFTEIFLSPFSPKFPVE